MTKLITTYVSGCIDCPLLTQAIDDYGSQPYHECSHPSNSKRSIHDGGVYVFNNSETDEPITPANCPIKTQPMLILPK